MNMQHLPLVAGALLLMAAAPKADAACAQKRSRDPSFVELAIPDGARRPENAQEFAFVTDDTTVDQLVEKVGPPDASQGTRMIYLIWCFADGKELTLATRDRVVIEYIRNDGKAFYKRGKKK
jgi:hypothetical protein